MAHDRVIEIRARRRIFVRYKLVLPVIFHWNDGTEQIEGGFTRDVGPHGALILSDRCPPAGAEVHIELLLPPIDDSSAEIRIRFSGRVVQINRLPAGAISFGVHGTFDDHHRSRSEAGSGAITPEGTLEPAPLKTISQEHAPR
jgi:hypothetical protein